jgi:hypothetical protein
VIDLLAQLDGGLFRVAALAAVFVASAAVGVRSANRHDHQE